MLLQRLHILIPSDPQQLIGAYRYDQHMVDGLRAAGLVCEVHRVEGRFPWPDERAAAATDALLRGAVPGQTVLVDGLLLASVSDVLARNADRLRLVGLVHHPLGLEPGLSPSERSTLEAAEHRSLLAMRQILVTSAHTREIVAKSGIPIDRIRVAAPGTDAAPLARGTAPSGGPVHLVCVGPLVPRKGHENLVDALAGLAKLRWTASLAGSLTRNAETTRRVQERIEKHRLGDRIRLLGDIDAAALNDLYARADVYVQPSLYEGYGMAISEAVARGLPVVSTRAGAIPSTAPAEASLLAEPGDVGALTRALEAMISDTGHREKLAAGARKARERLVSWPEATARFAAELQRP